MTQVTQRQDSADRTGQALLVAFELSEQWWKLAFGAGGTRIREKTVPAGDLGRVKEAIAGAKRRFGLAEDASVFSCYEAGRDGFWPHRQLVAMRVQNRVVDPASVGVDRRARRKKTDRIDAKKLLRCLGRDVSGERDVWSVVRVPTVEQEDARRQHRERDRLRHERTAHKNRIRALVLLHGERLPPRGSKRFTTEVRRLLEGGQLPQQSAEELRRELQRLELVTEQIRQLDEQHAKDIAVPQGRAAEQVSRLTSLRGVGPISASVIVYELFAWRTYENRRQLAASVGLAPTPHQSGQMDRELGISKAGNRWVRSVIIELAWSWLRYQPQSALSQWFQRNYGPGSSRLRRVGIVALARRLLIALWRFTEQGVVPEGAC